MKKTLLFGLVACLMLGTFVLANDDGHEDETNTTGTVTAEAVVTSEKPTKPVKTISADTIACVTSALTAREASVKTAFQGYDASWLTAFDTRTTSYLAAAALTTQKEAKKAMDAASKTYKKAIIAAKKTKKNGVQTAWNTYRKSMYTCKGDIAKQFRDEKGSSDLED